MCVCVCACVCVCSFPTLISINTKFQIKHFLTKKFCYFSDFSTKIHSKYSLEALPRDGSNEFLQCMFSCKNQKLKQSGCIWIPTLISSKIQGMGEKEQTVVTAWYAGYKFQHRTFKISFLFFLEEG